MYAVHASYRQQVVGRHCDDCAALHCASLHLTKRTHTATAAMANPAGNDGKNALSVVVSAAYGTLGDVLPMMGIAEALASEGARVCSRVCAHTTRRCSEDALVS